MLIQNSGRQAEGHREGIDTELLTEEHTTSRALKEERASRNEETAILEVGISQLFVVRVHI